MINESKINFVFKELALLSNKDQTSGYLPPSKFNTHIAMAQLDEVNSLLFGYEGDIANSDDIDFLKKTIVASVPTDGKYTQPNDLLRFGSAMKYFTFTVNGVVKQGATPIQVVRQSELGLRLSSQIKAPTESNPICVFHNNEIWFYPQNIGDVSLSYLKIPNKPEWGYTLVNNRPVFDLSSSTELEVGWDLIPNIIYRMCQYLGIQVKRLDLIQVMQAKINQEVMQQ